MEPGAEKKLKRGLEDLSPLFQTGVRPRPAVLPARSPSFEVSFVAVCVPDHEGDAFLANAYVASQLIRKSDYSASLISVAPPRRDGNEGRGNGSSKNISPSPSLEFLDSRISRLTVSHQQLWSLAQRETAPETFHSPLRSEPLLIFLEFEPWQFRSLARLGALLDRVVLFTAPLGDSLREAYRVMKIFSGLNPEIEFFLLFRGRVSPPGRGEFLFERFSLIASRFLSISPTWLGDLAFPEKTLPPWSSPGEGLGFNLDPLLRGEGLRRPLSPEKSRFWYWLQRTLLNRPPR